MSPGGVRSSWLGRRSRRSRHQTSQTPQRRRLAVTQVLDESEAEQGHEVPESPRPLERELFESANPREYGDGEEHDDRRVARPKLRPPLRRPIVTRLPVSARRRPRRQPPSPPSRSNAGANSARLEARTVMVPIPSRPTRRSTATSTTRGLHERSMRHEHIVSTTPFDVARRRASATGVPVAPNGRKVTGAAARAAASAAAAACSRAEKAIPTSATATENRRTRAATASRSTAAEPRSRLTAQPA